MIYKFQLFNKEYNILIPIGILCYNSDTKEFHVRINEKAPSSVLPIYLCLKAKQGIYDLNAEDSRTFIQDRLVPFNRVNIRELLNTIGIDEYDEFEILKFFHARCVQDACYMEQVNSDDLYSNTHYSMKEIS